MEPILSCKVQLVQKLVSFSKSVISSLPDMFFYAQE